MTTKPNKPIAPLLIAFAIGASLWLAASFLSGKREPWDSSLYWAGAYPLAVLGCALLGYVFPEPAWRWAIALFEAQFVAMCFRNGEIGSLWPLGMLMFAIISIPGIIAAKLAAKFKLNRAPERRVE